jgi:hypothetical protein
MIFQFKTFRFQLIMLHKFVSTAVIGVFLVKYILTYFIETFANIQIKLKEILDYLCIDLRVFSVHLLFADEMEIVRKVSLIPRVLLDFLEGYPFHRVRLQHHVDQVFDSWGDVIGDEVSTLLDFAKQLRHLVVVKW